MKKHRQSTRSRALELKRESVAHLGLFEHDPLKHVIGGSEANSMHPSQCVSGCPPP